MAAVDAIADLARSLREAAPELPLRWVPPANYHVTLKFLGEVRPEAVEAVRDAVGAGLRDEAALRFAMRGVGAFPALERARVLWVGVDDPGHRLAALAAAVEAAVTPLGFPRERRAFHPHVTIARVRGVADVRTAVIGFTEQPCSETAADRVTLFESRIKPGGSEYVVRAEWPLRQTGPVQPESGQPS